jgi:hypothetical protein
MDDPDVILCVHRYANRHTQQPMIGQWFRPHGIDFKSRRLHAGRLRGNLAINQQGSDTKRDQQAHSDDPQVQSASHSSPPPVCISKVDGAALVSDMSLLSAAC